MFDNQFFTDRNRNVGARRQRTQRALKLFALKRDPRRSAAALGQLDSLGDRLELAAALGHAYHLTHPNQVGRQIDHLAIDRDMPMAYQLARLGARMGEAQPINQVVETPLEQHQQVFARDTGSALRQIEVMREFGLQQTVNALYLLLFTQPDRKLRKARAALTMRTRRIIAPLDRALVRVTALALQKQLESLAPTHPAYGTEISSHWS